MSLEISMHAKATAADFSAKFISFTHSLNDIVAQKIGIEKLCDLFIHDFHRLFSTEKILLLFIDDENNLLYLKRAFITNKVLAPIKKYLDWNETVLLKLVTQSMQTKKPQRANSGFLHEILPVEWFNQQSQNDRQELIFVPLIAENRIKGFLAADFPLNQEVEPRFDYIAAFCSWLAVTMDYAWHLEKVQNFNFELEKKVELKTQELKNTQVQLIQQEKMAGLGQLTAGIAHEINNPLAFVMNNIALLKEDLLLSSVLLDFEALKTIQQVSQMADNQSSAQFQLQQKLLKNLANISRFKEDAIDVEMELTQLNFAEQQNLLQKFLQYAEQTIDQNQTTGEDRLNRNRKFAEDALDGLERTKKIILDLRNFSRLDEAEFQFANIDEGIVNTLNIIQHLAKDKEIRLIKQLAIPFLVLCFPSKLNQVIMNLVVNAIQASPQGSEIVISSYEEMNEVLIMVVDHGVGIPTENLTKIFDPYFTTKPIGQGTGLGLSLSYQIIEDHKGTIRVKSELGHGTAFTIKLPCTERKIIS